jgi:hypothetical protein
VSEARGSSHTSSRALAALARSGYALLRQTSDEVEFEVRHIDGAPTYLADLVKDGEPVGFKDALMTHSYGLGLIVGTRARRSPGGDAAGHKATHPLVDNWGRTEYLGRTRPSITFLQDFEHVFEGIISIEDEPRKVLFGHAQALHEVVQMLGDLADRMKAPILSVQSPAQTPPHPSRDSRITSDGSSGLDDAPSRASSFSVRFSIAMRETSIAASSELADDLVDFARTCGFGLWLADSRSGHRTGNWFQVVTHNRQQARDRLRKGAAGPKNAVEGALPLTFVGPARRGSTSSILAYLNELYGSGVVACSITALDDIDFIHVDMAVRDASRKRLGEINNAILPSLRTGPDGIGDKLAALSSVISSDTGSQPSMEARAELIGKVGDYQAFLGRAFPLRMDRATSGVALWVSWQTQGALDSASEALRTLGTALESLESTPATDAYCGGLDPRIDYLICRDLGNGATRGKGKIVVSEEFIEKAHRRSALQSPLTEFCNDLERAWMTLTRNEKESSLREVSVSWRENWLGHWSSSVWALG